MNLIEIQDDLKGLPQSPQTMQALMSYANGANPEVPPYLALAELNRRKQMQQRAQVPQAPQGTVKDAIAQQMGIMSLQQGRQQQAMQQMMQGAQQQQAQVPPQVAQQGPVQAARGGLLAKLMQHPAMRNAARRYNSGGIVSFAEGDLVDPFAELRTPPGAEEEASDDPEERLRQLRRESRELRDTGPQRADYDPEARRRAFEQAYPELAAQANRDVSAEALKRMDEMQAARRAEIERQRQEAAKNRPSILSMMGQAALQTRGTSGAEALARILGGYGAASQEQRAKSTEQEQGFRAKELELQQLRVNAQDKLDEANRARAEGRMNDYARAMGEFEKANNAFRAASMTAVGREITAAESAATRRDVAQMQADARKFAAQQGANKPARTTDFGMDVQATFAKIKQDNPEMSDTDAMAQAVKEASARRQVVGAAGVAQRTAKDADAFFDSIKYSRAFRDYREKAGLSELDAAKQIKQDYINDTLPPTIKAIISGGAPAAAAAAGAPTRPASQASTAKVMTRADVEATARSTGRTTKEVEEAARARGYTIQ